MKQKQQFYLKVHQCIYFCEYAYNMCTQSILLKFSLAI